jgi:hypothetical protein
MLKSFRMELEKIAARRGLREIRRLVGSGKMEQAEALARRPGVLKPTLLGHQVRDLGAGAEGVATLTAGGTAHGGGLGVQKIYNPSGLASSELIARKEQAGRALQSNPHVAQFRGSQQGVGGTTAHAMEFVHGREPEVEPEISPQTYAQIRAARKGIAKGMRQAGFAGAVDVRPGNMIQTPSGQIKVIDYMPVYGREFASGNFRAYINKVRQSRGQDLVPKNIQLPIGDTNLLRSTPEKITPDQLKALHFRGVKPMPEQTPKPAAKPAAGPGTAQIAPPVQSGSTRKLSLSSTGLLPTSVRPVGL